jgi:hypothetical protein
MPQGVVAADSGDKQAANAVGALVDALLASGDAHKFDVTARIADDGNPRCRRPGKRIDAHRMVGEAAGIVHSHLVEKSRTAQVEQGDVVRSTGGISTQGCVDKIHVTTNKHKTVRVFHRSADQQRYRRGRIRTHANKAYLLVSHF